MLVTYLFNNITFQIAKKMTSFRLFNVLRFTDIIPNFNETEKEEMKTLWEKEKNGG